MKLNNITVKREINKHIWKQLRKVWGKADGRGQRPALVLMGEERGQGELKKMEGDMKNIGGFWKMRVIQKMEGPLEFADLHFLQLQ